MRTKPSQPRSSIAPAGHVAGAGAGQGDGTVALPRLGFGPPAISVARPRLAFGPLAGKLALAALIASAFAVVLFATSSASTLVPRSGLSFPHWESGPLHHLFGALTNDADALSWGFSAVLLAMFGAYLVVLASMRALSMRTIVVSVLVLHAILLMSAPLQLTDIFNYLGYARLGGVHHLNLYTHVMADELHDPVFRFTSWHRLHSPYGPLFSAATYPLAWMALPVAYWTFKVVTVLASLGFIALVARCAKQLGRDPRFAIVFVAANPIYLMYEVAGFHNDFFMLIPSMVAISLLLARRDRAAGAALMLAVAVKFTAVLLLPFLLLAARPSSRRREVLAGAALGAIPLVALSVALFGLSLPNLADQSTLITDLSIPNVFGDLVGIGGAAPALLRAANVALVLVVAYEIWRRRDWLTSAGWSTLALIASLAWLVPWYVVWLLPLAALGMSIRLRKAALVLTLYLIFAFMPVTGIVLSQLGIDPMGSSVGQASKALQRKLAQ